MNCMADIKYVNCMSHQMHYVCNNIYMNEVSFHVPNVQLHINYYCNIIQMNSVLPYCDIKSVLQFYTYQICVFSCA